MAQIGGKKGREVYPPTVTISTRSDGKLYAMNQWAETLEKIRQRCQYHETKVIFNPPATILYMNGKKYVSKVHDEEFDEEKGLLMCLAKAHGHSHGELKQMLKNAKRQTNKKKEIKVMEDVNPIEREHMEFIKKHCPELLEEKKGE